MKGQPTRRRDRRTVTLKSDAHLRRGCLALTSRASGHEPSTGKRALVCAPLMPEFDREGGSRRTYDFILFLRDQGWSVTFVSRSSMGPADRYVKVLEEAGVVALPMRGDNIDDLIRRGQFDLAILAFWHIADLYLPALRALSPRTKVIVDSIDLHFVRNAREAFVQPTDASLPGLVGAGCGEEFARELNAYAAADAVAVVSNKEAELLNILLGDQANAHVVPLCDDMRVSTRPFNRRRGLLFIGNFRHAPNIYAVQYLCDDILPRLPADVLESHPLYIVGNGLDDTVREAVAGLNHIRLGGWVPDLAPYLEQTRVAVVPLRYGAGTKCKVIQSLMIGTPSVSTTICIEGLDLQNGDHVSVADDAESFAEAIVRLTRDRTLWHRLASNGRRHIVATHSRETARRQFLEIVEAALRTTGKRPSLQHSRRTTALYSSPHVYTDLVERVGAAV